MISFVLVTLADPTAPDGTVSLLRVPALVQKTHDDKSADLTVFSNTALVASRSACFFLEKVPLDTTGSKAPSYAPAEPEAAPAPASEPVALAKAGPATLAASTPPEQVRRVFGKGASRMSSSRSSAIRRFESLGVAAAKGTATPEQLLRTVGSPKAMLPGQQPPRVFVKGKGEVTSREHTDRIAAAVAGSGEVNANPEVDPMGDIEAMLNMDDEPSPGEVPAPLPIGTEPQAAGPAPHANGTKHTTTSGQPL